VFIIDLVGGGRSCRCLLKKGGLTLVTEETNAGLALFIVND
jgi:hypothetical protein